MNKQNKNDYSNVNAVRKLTSQAEYETTKQEVSEPCVRGDICGQSSILNILSNQFQSTYEKVDKKQQQFLWIIQLKLAHVYCVF